jgi:hypothetical protein
MSMLQGAADIYVDIERMGYITHEAMREMRRDQSSN